MSQPQLILASASPRRRDLLAEFGLPFTVLPAEIPEIRGPGERPAQLAERLALAKAEAVRDRIRASRSPQRPTLVIGADTVVVDGQRVLSKPRDPEDAIRMLRRLQGRSHRVVTAVAVIDVQSGRAMVRSTTTRVWIRPLTAEEIAAYVATGDPLDKAGAYAIQNRAFQPVRQILGCYTNVVGLPLCTLAEVLAAFGVSVNWPPRTDPLACGCRALASGRTGEG